MSRPVDELLSAFHDGELNAVERTSVEQRLVASNEARQELSEIRQISTLLKEVSQRTLPAEFASQVLNGLEREMLIPTDHLSGTSGAATVRTLLSKSKDSLSRRWLMGVAAVVSSAAGLLLMLQVFSPGSRSANQRGVELAGSPNFASAPDSLEVASADAPVSSTAAGGFGGGSGPRPMAAPGAAVADQDSAKSSDRLAPTVAAKSKPQDQPTGFSPAKGNETSNLFFDQQKLREAEIGDVVEAVRTVGEEIAVVKLTVVDRQNGFERLQLLLTKNQITADEPGVGSKRDESDSVAKDSSLKIRAKQPAPSVAESQQLLAVFVESDSQQMASVLKQLRETDYLQSLEVDQPILMAELNDATQDGKPLANAKQLAGGGALPGKMGRRDARKLPTEEKDKSALAKEQQATSNSRQYSLQLPANSLTQSLSADSARNQSRSSFRYNATDATTRVADGKSSAELRPMQVLFVVVDQAQSGKPASSKAGTASPKKTESKPANPLNQDGAHRGELLRNAQPA